MQRRVCKFWGCRLLVALQLKYIDTICENDIPESGINCFQENFSFSLSVRISREPCGLS